MAVSVTHNFVSLVADEGDPNEVGPDEWNAAHTVTLGTDKLLGRDTAGTGAVEEIGVTAPISFDGAGNITATAADLLTALKTVDGSGSGLDADTLDGNSSAAFQPIDADLTSWAGVTRASGFDTFAATPSSANFASLVTGETGSGALVFGTSPGFTTAANPVSDDGAALGTTALGWSDVFFATGATVHFANTDWVATHTTGILTVGTGDLRVTTAGANTASVVTVGGTQTLTSKTLTSPTIGTSPTAAGATWTDLGTVTTADINGGTIDGATIGGSTAAAVTGTTITATTGFMPDADDGAYLGQSGTGFSDLFLAEGGVINWDGGDATITQTGNDIAIAGITTLTIPCGIVFPATQVADAGANTLDDYEEGTFSPTWLSSSGSFGTIDYDSGRFGRYRKIGSQVIVNGLISTDTLAINTATGNLSIGTLPITSGITAAGYIGWAAGFAGEHPSGMLVVSTSLNLYYRVTSITGALNAQSQAADLTTGSSADANTLYFAAVYSV